MLDLPSPFAGDEGLETEKRVANPYLLIEDDHLEPLVQTSPRVSYYASREECERIALYVERKRPRTFVLLVTLLFAFIFLAY